MAFTSVQRLKIITLLGWPAKTLDSTSLSYSKILSDRLTVDSDTQALTEEYLGKIAVIDDNIIQARTRSGVKAIDDIQFFGSDTAGSSEFKILRSERSRMIREMAAVLDMAIGPGAGINNGQINVCV